MTRSHDPNPRYPLIVRSMLVLALAACGHAPAVTGAELYAQVHTLQATGRATVGSLTVRKDQVLTTDDQIFEVQQVIERCHGGDPGADVDCTLALLLDKRFTVLDHAPHVHEAHPAHDQSGPLLSSGAVIVLGLAAIGGLAYGVAACDFPGCRAVFGVPIVFVAGAGLFALGRD